MELTVSWPYRAGGRAWGRRKVGKSLHLRKPSVRSRARPFGFFMWLLIWKPDIGSQSKLNMGDQWSFNSPSFSPKPRPSWDGGRRQGWQRFQETTWQSWHSWLLGNHGNHDHLAIVSDQPFIFWALQTAHCKIIGDLKALKKKSNLPTSVLRSPTSPLVAKSVH